MAKKEQKNCQKYENKTIRELLSGTEEEQEKALTFLQDLSDIQKKNRKRRDFSTDISSEAAFISENPEMLKSIKYDRFLQVIANLKKQGYKQVGIAKKLGVDPGNLSAIINGKKGLTSDLILKINDAFPQYSIEWLQGKSFYANEGEEGNGNKDALPLHDEWTFDFVRVITGVDLKPMQSRGYYSPLPYDQQKADLEKQGYDINGKICLLSKDDINNLLNEIRDFVKFKINTISSAKERPEGLFSSGESYDMFIDEVTEKQHEIASLNRQDHEQAIQRVIDIEKKYLSYENKHARSEAESILSLLLKKNDLRDLHYRTVID